MNNASLPANSRKRITSIDALRAFTLLGILLVHAAFGYSFTSARLETTTDFLLLDVNDYFLASKCNKIFNALFGISFYLILRNPNNTSGKFVWRCFLLMLIGVLNKVVYLFDVLMWYGFWGMFLVFFRNMKPKWLITICVGMLLANSLVLSKLHLGTLLFGPVMGNKYAVGSSLIDVITYPSNIVDYLRAVLNSGIIGTLATFMLGYWIASIGFIEHLEERLTKRFLLITWIFFVVFFISDFLLRQHGIKSMRTFADYSGSVAYASALLYAYYHCGWCNRILKLFEPYGKLGLTNYSLGGILGVIFMGEFGFGLCRYPLTTVILFFIGFFLLQAVFSYYWLRYFTYGPMEYVWRVATERQPIPFLRKLSV